MTNSKFLTALEQAAIDEFSWLNTFQNPYEKYEFSNYFQDRINKISNQAKSTFINVGRARIRKNLLIAVIALLALAITGCSVALHYIVTWNEKENIEQGTLDVTFDIEENASSNGQSPSLPKTPSGFTVVSEYKDDWNCIIEYSNKNGETILLSRGSNIENMGLSINNEADEFKEISIGGYKGYSFSDEGLNAIYWCDGIYFYTLQGTCNSTILIDMLKTTFQ